MQALKTLIDKAAKVCGSQAELARQLHMSRQHVTHMKSGARAITPAIAVILADIAHEDIDEALRQATIESEKDSPLEYRVGQILKNRQGGGSGLRGPLNITQMTPEDIKANASETTEELMHIIYRGLRTEADDTASKAVFFRPRDEQKRLICSRKFVLQARGTLSGGLPPSLAK